MYKDLLSLFKPFKKSQIALIFISFMEYTFLAGVTFSIMFLVDYLQQNKFEQFKRLSVICILLMLVTLLLSVFSHYYWNKTIRDSIIFLRGLVLKGIIKKNPLYFITHTTGDIVSKIMDDVVIVAQTGSIGVPMLSINIFRILIVAAALFYLSFPLTIAIIVFIPLYFLSFNLINKKMRNASLHERAKYSAMQSSIQETLSAIETIKIYKKEDYIQTQVHSAMQEFLTKYKPLNKYQSIGSGISSIFSIFLPVFIIYLGAFLAFGESMSMGTLISYYAFLPFLVEPVNNLSDHYLGSQTTLGMAERIMEYLRDDQISENKIPIQSIEAVSFVNVNYRYDDEHDYILNRFNLELKSGDRVAVLGNSGSGKSTLLKLMIHFLNPTSGQIKINGLDLNDIDISSYYDCIALLQQDPFIFKDTILNNITFGDPYSDEEIQNAVTNANVSSFAEKLPDALHYRIEEIGKNISGGEQQRITLARAFIRDADLLLLDEPTSSLDEENEKMLVERIDAYLNQRNCIFVVVTHRKEILNICTKVIYFRNGHIQLFDLADEEQNALLKSWMEE